MIRLLMPTMAIALLSACAVATVEMPFDGDNDGDGLLNSEEITLETNPDLADSDADDWDDLAEIESNTDPNNPDDHPYQGGWQMDDCRNDIVGESVAVGSIAPNFALLDQYGDTLRLHDFCGQAVMLVFGAGW
jgi:hypothetical protein